jgi:hypothetical protein
MSNRIAAYRPADLRAVAAWAPQVPSRGAVSLAVDYLRDAMASRVPATLSARLRRDAGLGSAVASSGMAELMLGVEARRLGF